MDNREKASVVEEEDVITTALLEQNNVAENNNENISRIATDDLINSKTSNVLILWNSNVLK
jgi:hypothetical protein